MIQFNDTFKKLNLFYRIWIALVFFSVALYFRFTLIPQNNSGPFLTFYPAIILSFYFCGAIPGALIAIVSGIVGAFYFIPPFKEFPQDIHISSTVLIFLITASLIGIITTLLLRHIEQLKVVLDNELIGSMMLKNRKIIWCNKGMCQILGYTQSELTGASTKLLFAQTSKFEEIGREAYPMHKGKPYRTQFEMRRSNGQHVWVDISGASISYDPTLTLWLVNDISKLKRLEEELSHQVNHDFLTGLNSRSWFMRQAEIELHRAIRYTNPLSILMLDIDFFKRINDTHGHQAGDMVLKDVAELCIKMLRDSDVCGRLGGEEFALLLPETDPHQALEVAERIRIGIERAKIVLPSDGTLTQLTVSIGISSITSKEETVDGLIERADKALYEAKNSGRNRVYAS